MLIILENIFAFIVILSIIVFVHEFGHYYVAKKFGVKVEEFSIGFGKELYSWKDKSGTKWKICLMPFGGFVKMFGDENPASKPDKKKLQKISENDKKYAFYFKNVYQRFAIVIAGPLANFLLAIIIFAMLTRINGITSFAPKVDEIIPGSTAEQSGILVGDIITSINGEIINQFEEIKTAVSLSTNPKMKVGILRDGNKLEIEVTLKTSKGKDIFGNEVKTNMIGIASNTVIYEKVTTLRAITHSFEMTYDICANTLKALGQIITGQRSTKDLGGPLKIAQYSAQSFHEGIGVFIWFIAMISANLGLMNLLPIPVIDGGHLLFYIVEMIFRKPVNEKIQERAFQIGLYFIIGLMAFATVNDIVGFFN
jgi:regulator of sigma E protease